MRAVHVPTEGAALEVGDLPVPMVDAHSVLVEVVAAGLNPIDIMVSQGRLTEMLEHRFPVVLGRDLAGTVRAIGAAVADLAVGDQVVGSIPLVAPVAAGSLAEYAVVPAHAVVRKPDPLDFTRAAAIPLAGSAAFHAVEGIDPRPGQVVLVNGASGGVGSFAVQLLAARGAVVVATSTPDDEQRLAGLGARTVLDYTTGDLDQQFRRSFPEGADALVNLTGFDVSAIPVGVLKPGSKVATTTASPDDAALSALNLTITMVRVIPTRRVLDALVGLAAAGDLQVAVVDVLPLERAGDGLETIAAGLATGKIVVAPGLRV